MATRRVNGERFTPTSIISATVLQASLADRQAHALSQSSAIRAAARLIISPRRICAGAILSFMKASTSGGAVSGEPELNGGAVLYSRRSWIASAVFWSCSSETSVSAKSMAAGAPPPATRVGAARRDTRQREVDAGGDAAAGDAVAVDADARPGRDRAVRREEVHRRPVGRRAITLEQAGGAEHQRTRADRGDVFCTRRLLAQEGQHLLVVDHVVGAEPAGHADDVELRAVRKGRGR